MRTQPSTDNSRDLFQIDNESSQSFVPYNIIERKGDKRVKNTKRIISGTKVSGGTWGASVKCGAGTRQCKVKVATMDT